MSTPSDPARTSLALCVVGCVLVGAAFSMQLWLPAPGENEAATMLTLTVLGGSCFVGNVQGGSAQWKLFGAVGVLLGLWALVLPLRQMWVLW